MPPGPAWSTGIANFVAAGEQAKLASPANRETADKALSPFFFQA